MNPVCWVLGHSWLTDKAWILHPGPRRAYSFRCTRPACNAHRTTP